MGTFYSIYGSVTVKDVPEVDDILESLSTMAGEIEIDENENEDETITLTFGGGQMMSYESVAQLDETIQELGPYAVENVYLNYERDGEFGYVYVGQPECEAELYSSECLEKIKGLINSLTPDDLESLKAHLNG